MGSPRIGTGRLVRTLTLTIVPVVLFAACAVAPGGAPDSPRGTESGSPLIVVESPEPHATVSSPFAVTGTSNTYEANVRYRLIGPGGREVDDGSTTATAGNGSWGRFSFVITAGGVGKHVLELWQPDTRSGDRRDLVRLDVRVVPTQPDWR